MPDTEGNQIELSLDCSVDRPAADKDKNALGDVAEAKIDVDVAPVSEDREDRSGIERGNPEVRSLDDDHPETPESGLQVRGTFDSEVEDNNRFDASDFRPVSPDASQKDQSADNGIAAKWPHTKAERSSITLTSDLVEDATTLPHDRLKLMMEKGDAGHCIRLAMLFPDLVAQANTADGRAVLMLADPNTGFWHIPRDSGDLGLLRRLLELAEQEALHLAGEQSIEVGVKMERALSPITDARLRRIWLQATAILTDRGLGLRSVSSADLDLVYKRPVMRTPTQTIDLASGEPVDPADLLPEFLLNRAPTCVDYVPKAHEANSPGAQAMRDFIGHLGNGNPTPVVRRVAYHLCGPH